MQTSSVLDAIVSNKLAEIAERKNSLPQESLAGEIQPASGKFLQVLSEEGLKLITEIKPFSPSAGVLRQLLDIAEIVNVYSRYAAAISVLTDKKYFGGSLELLSEVVSKSAVPVLRKDFILDPYQVYEARKAGAEAILLIVKILSPELLSQLYDLTCKLNMTAVVEVQSEDELKMALAVNPSVVLINNRNLQDLQIDLQTTIRLSGSVPRNTICISASGIETRRDIDLLLPYCRHFLIGSVLMRSDNLEAKLRELRGL